MSKLVPVDVNIDTNMDADDLGKNLVDCLKQMSINTDVVNLVKVHLNKDVPAWEASSVIKSVLVDPLKEMGAKNCIFVLLKEGLIDDITIDYIEVRNDEANS